MSKFECSVGRKSSSSAQSAGAVLLTLLSCLILTLVLGCKKSSPADERNSQTTSSPSTPDTRRSTPARIHWLGKKRIAAETNAAAFMKIWNLPESMRVETQTLDKLATAPWRLLKLGTIPSAATNAQTPIGASPLLRPLLDDLVQEECYFEISQPTNQASEIVLAIKLDDARARLWETNLAAVIESLGGTGPRSSGSGKSWQISHPGQGLSRLVELARSGQWTILGLGAQASSPAVPGLHDLVTRIQRDQAPFPPPATNFWLQVDGFDLRPVTDAIGLTKILPDAPPMLSFTVIGDVENVLTRGQLDFTRPIPYREEKWNIPTNLLSQYMASFTAIRGIGPWLASFKPWNELRVGAPPNQFYVWAPMGADMETYFAAPQPDASNQVSKLTDIILEKTAPFLATNQLAKLQKASEFNGLEWKGVPFIMPFLKSLNTNGENWVYGGFFQPMVLPPPPAELLQQIYGQTNLVCYDWEATGPRMDQWLYLTQFFRFAMYRAQLDLELAGEAWLKKVGLTLGNCGTVFTLTASNRLSFVRKSSVGFSAIEMNLMADWLEGPSFPCGYHSQAHSDLLPDAPPTSDPKKPQTSPGPSNP